MIIFDLVVKFICPTLDLCDYAFWGCDLREKSLLDICLTAASVCYWLGLSHASIYFVDFFCVFSVANKLAPLPEVRISCVFEWQ